MRISDYFDATAARLPQNAAVIEGDTRVDFAEAQAFVHAVAHALDREPGLRKGAHVALYAPNHHRIPLLLLAINRADMVWLSAHTRNPVEVNVEVLGFMDCEFVFFHSACEHLVPQLKAGLSKVVRFVCIDRPSEYGVLLDDGIADCRRPYAAGLEDPMAACFIQPTGGTTGPSKAAVHTNRGMELSFFAGREAMEYDSQSRYLAVAPLTHAGGISALHTLLSGGCCVVINMTDPGQVFDAIERWGITHLFLPPTVVYLLMGLPRAQTTDFSSLRYLIAAASPFAPEKIVEAVGRFGPVVCQAFGQTESGFPTTFMSPREIAEAVADPARRHRLLSCGRPTAIVEAMEIMDENGRILGPNETGEVVLRGPTMMSRYLDDDEATAEIQKFGWHHTGDIGKRDDDGYFYITDRKRDLIISGGFNIFPFEVESALMQHPAVQDCAVIGVPDAQWGEAVKACVQLKPGMKVGADELIDHAKALIGSMKAPKSVDFVENLPRSPVGKVLKRELRTPYWEGKARAVS